MIFDKGTKIIQWGKGSLQKSCWENWISTCKRMNLDLYLIPYTKINAKWIKDLNVRAKIINLLEENIGQQLHGIGFGSDFLDMTPKAQATKENIDKLDFLKSFK